LQLGEIDIIEGVHDNEHNQVTWHTSAGYFQSVFCPRKDANVILGCMLTPPVNGSYTGTIVVSYAFTRSTTVFTSISNKTINHTSTARAVALTIYLDAVSSNGAGHHTGPPSMTKGVAFSL